MVYDEELNTLFATFAHDLLLACRRWRRSQCEFCNGRGGPTGGKCCATRNSSGTDVTSAAVQVGMHQGYADSNPTQHQPPCCPSCCSCSIVVTAEKRFIFTMRDQDARAPAFAHFLSFVHNVCAPESGGCGACSAWSLSNGKLFLGERMDVGAVDQHVSYERGCHLELWRLWLPCQMSRCASVLGQALQGNWHACGIALWQTDRQTTSSSSPGTATGAAV